jgi:branched-chain amino acid transport system permease protein
MNARMFPRIVGQSSPEHRAWQAVGYGSIAVLVLLIALLLPDYRIIEFSSAAAWAVALLGVNLIIGYAGQMALGQSAFFGMGGYITAILFTDFGWNFLETLPVSALSGAVIGVVLGLPALRISGNYLALVTLALALAFPSIVKMDQLSSHTGGANGKLAFIPWTTPSWFPLDVSNSGWVFLTLSVIAALLFWLASNATRSRAGRAVIALRDNETGAAVSGVHPATWKTATFAVSSAYAALGGSMMILAVSIVGPDSGGFLVAITLITGMVLGGAGTISGAVVGALAVVWLPELSSSWAGHIPLLGDGEGAVLSNAVYGLILILVVFVMPGGVVSFIRGMRERFIRFVPTLPAPSSGEDTERSLLPTSLEATDA